MVLSAYPFVSRLSVEAVVSGDVSRGFRNTESPPMWLLSLLSFFVL